MKLVAVAADLQIMAPSPFDARFLYREIFVERCYGALALPPRALVVDVGANIGLFALYVKAGSPDARVLAFEPAPAAAEALRRNIEMHRLADVAVHMVALGEADQQDVPFTYYPLIPCNSTLHPDDQQALKATVARTLPARLVDRMYSGEQIRVPVARLSRFLAGEASVDLLKIDAVGAELEILAGLDAADWARIRRVIVELQDIRNHIAALCDVLRSQGLEPAVRQSTLAQGDDLNFIVDAARP